MRSALAPRLLAAVAVGGALGATVRHAVSVVLGGTWGADALATLLVNVTGSFAVGAVVALVLDRPGEAERPVPRGFLVTGLLGGYTTFSALAVEVRDGLADHGLAATAALVAATLVLGPLAALLGLRLGDRRARPWRTVERGEP